MALNFQQYPILGEDQYQHFNYQRDLQQPLNQAFQMMLQMEQNNRQKELQDYTRGRQEMEDRYNYGYTEIKPPVPQNRLSLFGGGQTPMMTPQADQVVNVPGMQGRKDEMDLMLKGGQLRKDLAQAEYYSQNRGKSAYGYDAGGNPVFERPKEPAGYRYTNGGNLEPIPGGPAEIKASAANMKLDSALELYETARDGLMSGLGGSMTGPIVGRMPAYTSNQQIAEGSVAAMAPVLKQLFRVAGEGVFTDRDQALLLQMIPTRNTRPEARQAQIANIDRIVKAKLGGQREQMPSGAPSKIRVRNRSTGQTGTISEKFFDPNKYERL